MFKFLLSPETRARLEAERTETFRLFGLTDDWLANALLKLAREAQATSTSLRPDTPTYNARLIYGIVPEVARRLGAVNLNQREIDYEIRALSDYGLRVRAGHCIGNIADSNEPGWALLTRDVGFGNPVAFALDRILPGRPGDRDDPINRRVQELAETKRLAYTGSWFPDVYLADSPHDAAVFEALSGIEPSQVF